MKRCPQCGRDYFDESLSFCLDDGEHLLEGPGTSEPRTAILPAGRSSDSPGSQAISENEQLPDRSGASVAGSGTGRWLIPALVTAVLILAGFAAYRYLRPGE